MINSDYLKNNQVKSLIRFNECYAFIMIAIFSLMPLLAMFSPPDFGPIFTGIAKFEIYGFVFLGLFQLISYAGFSTGQYTLKDRIKFCFSRLFDSIVKNKTGLLLLITFVIIVISSVIVFLTNYDAVKESLIVSGSLNAGDFASDGTGSDTLSEYLKVFFESRIYKGTDFRPDGIRMCACFMVIFVYSSMIKDKLFKKAIYITNIVCFGFLSLVMLQQYYGIIGSAGVKDAGVIGARLSAYYDRLGMRYGHFYKGMTASFYNLNHFAYYATVASMLISGLVISSRTVYARVLWSVAAAYSYYIIIANNTMGCFVAVAAALVITSASYIFKAENKNSETVTKALLPLIILLTVCLIFSVANKDNNPIRNNFTSLKKDAGVIAKTENIRTDVSVGSGRGKLWAITADMIKEKPMFGWGMDNLKAEYTSRDVKLDRAHNEPLERAVSTGVPSALMFYAAVGIGIYYFYKKKGSFSKETDLLPFMAMLGYLISSFFGVFLFYTGGFFIMMLAFTASKEPPVIENSAKSTKKKRKK